MHTTDDPFERAVAREQKLRRRAESMDSRSGILRFVLVWFAAIIVGWAVLLGGHWILFPAPRWLVILHTVAFALVVGYWCTTAAFVTAMRRRRPDWFEFD